MPIPQSIQINKDSIPDRKMELKLNDEEMKKFLEAFPDFEKIKTPIDDTWNPATVTVIVTVEAFKKKSNG